MLAVFQNPQGYLGKKVAMSGDKKTIAEYAAVISRVTGNAILCLTVRTGFRQSPISDYWRGFRVRLGVGS